MKNLVVVIITFLLCSSSINSSAQVTVGKTDPDRFVFWFYVRAEIKIDREKKTPVYVIRTLGKTPKSGKTRKYEKDLWNYLLGGQQLAIGPFRDYGDVTDETMEKEIQNFHDSTANDEYYWFVLKFKISERKKKYLLERTAARVASGSLKAFKQLLWEGLGFSARRLPGFP